MESPESNIIALLVVVPVKAVQPLPVSNCQAPFVLSTAVTAMDSTAPSLSVIDPSTTMVATVFPVEVKLSTAIVDKVGAALPNTGASLMLVMSIEAVSLKVL